MTLHAMTIDVEEHFHASAMEAAVERESWATIPSRVEANTERLLELLEETSTRATFFVLGWVAERHRDLVRRIADRGHEVGSHGFSHELIYRQTRERFEEELKRSKGILEEITGRPVLGHRAASFSIRKDNLWALDSIAKLGFTYDSSVFPIWHDRYGVPGAPRSIYRLTTLEGGSLIEVPPTTLSFLGSTLPVAGGGYLRLFPTAWTRWAIRHIERTEGRSVSIYVHPWEVDPDQPRVAGLEGLSRFRHYVNLRKTEDRLRTLLTRFRFGSMSEMIDSQSSIPQYSVAVEPRVFVPA